MAIEFRAKKRYAILALLPLISLLLYSCGAGGGGFTTGAPTAENSKANVSITLPSGVTLKSGIIDTLNSSLYFKYPKLYGAKVTSISGTVTASDMDTVNFTIPIDTKETTIDVPAGSSRTFKITVETDTSGSFSGSETVDLVSGGTVNLNISVTVDDDHTVGGSLSGLGDGMSVTLQNSGGDDLTLSSNGSFTFATQVADGSTYSVTASSQPTFGACTVSSGSGTMAVSGVTDVSVSCTRLMGGAIQGKDIGFTAANSDVTTTAGTAGTLGSTDGTGTSASFNAPVGITTDVDNLYIAGNTNNIIRKLIISSAEVITFAGSGSAISSDGTGTSATFNRPTGVTTDGTNLYVTDRDGSVIRKIVISTQEVTTLAGSGTAGFTDGTSGAATFDWPRAITTDGTNLYVVDYNNNAIRKVVISTGDVTTFAGSGTGALTNGTGTNAEFKGPTGITTDGTNLYVADYLNHVIRKIVISTQEVTTLAGSGTLGSTDGTGADASFNGPAGVTTDGTSLYVANFDGHTMRKVVISSGAVTTIAGTVDTFGTTDGTSGVALLNNPMSLVTDGANIYITDFGNHTIRKIE